jgi:glycosyltransferase involved in cell wall biosynthesis
VNAKAWIIDPISYSGLAYYDLGLVSGLAANGVSAELIGSDQWLLAQREDSLPPFRPVFRGTATGGLARRGFNYLRSLVRLLALAIRDRPAIAHWQYIQLLPADLLAVLALRALGIPVVYTAHEVIPWRIHGSLALKLLRFLYLGVDRIVVHNPADRLELADRFAIDPDKIRVLQHGDFSLVAAPHLDQRVARARLGLPSDRPIALFFGTLRASKGLDLLLAAWPLVAEALPSAVLVVAGQPDRDLPQDVIVSLQQLASRSATRGAVTLRLERVPDAEVNAYYRAADVVVLPYHAITTSGVLRYAYSSGRPVVATAVGEHSTWVVPGVTGCLVPPRDPVALATALVRLLTDRDHSSALGERAREFAKTHFDWDRIAAATAAMYRELLPRALV